MTQAPAKKVKRVLWQPVMLKVMAAAAPCGLAAIYLFGWRCLAVLAVTAAAAFFTEALFVWPKAKPVTAAVFVSALLYGLSLPPTIPLWIAAIGIIFGILFGKMAFGGMGANIFNPALVGRCFIYISFPLAMTAGWVEPATAVSPAAGLVRWGVDTVSSATPLDIYQAGGTAPLTEMFLGRTAGSMGETSALLIILGALYLIFTKAASWQVITACLLGSAGTAGILHFADPGAVGGPLFQLLAGGLLFGAVFMATDPVSSAKTAGGRWIYGIGIGILTVILRGYSNFSCGVTFAILMMNMVAPLIDTGVKTWEARHKKSQAGAPAEGAA